MTHILSITKNGIGKKTDISEYKIQSRAGSGIIGITLSEADSLVTSSIIKEDQSLVVFTKNGKSIRCLGSDIPATSRTSKGVKVIKLDEKDEVVDIVVI